jgi:hypothetical protein
MVFDIEKHEENRMKFLAALYDIATEYDGGKSAITSVYEYESVIGGRAGLMARESDRIGSELEEDGLLEITSGDDRGPHVSLTSLGCQTAEAYLYEKSPLAKRRKLKAWVKTKAAEAAQIGAGKLLGWLGAVIVASIGIVKIESIARAIRHLLGY